MKQMIHSALYIVLLYSQNLFKVFTPSFVFFLQVINKIHFSTT